MNSLKHVRVRSRSNWNLEVLIFEEREKPEKNLSEQGREPTTNSTPHMEPGPLWWETPPLLPQISLLNMLKDDNSCVYFVVSCFAHYLTCFSSTIQLK